MAQAEVNVSFWLFGDFDPEAVSRRLGIAGSQHPARSGRWPRQASWTLSSGDDVQSDLFEPHMEWLLASIEPRAAALAALVSEGAEAHVNCDWSSSGSSGGPVISVESMSRLVSLKLPLVLSFHATGRAKE